MWQKLIRTDNNTASLVLRLSLGIVMFPHGAQKLFGWFGGYGPAATIEGFQGMGIPALVTVLVILAESLGALALIIGFAGRFMAFSIGAVMLGAMLIAHLQYGFFMNWYGQQAGEGIEYHLLAIGIAIALMITGSGRWSVDRAMMRDSGRPESAYRRSVRRDRHMVE
jgi:putative oxidoreductase